MIPHSKESTWRLCCDCTTWVNQNYVLRNRCPSCLASLVRRHMRRALIDIQMFMGRKKLEPGAHGRSANNFWVWCDHVLDHDGKYISALSSCPYCLELIKRWKLPHRTDVDLNELRRRRPEEPYSGFWWHMREWFNFRYHRHYRRCRHCNVWLTKKYVTKEYGVVCVDCRHKYCHP
jgi:hypothetical protein